MQLNRCKLRYERLKNAGLCPVCGRKRSNPEHLRCTVCRLKSIQTKDQVKDAALKRDYGITLKQYKEMFYAQRGGCKICEKPCKSGRALAVDHCHKTGKVRGLLCCGCNASIGWVERNLTNALSYLGVGVV